jgi:hypothetical protein
MDEAIVAVREGFLALQDWAIAQLLAQRLLAR